MLYEYIISGKDCSVVPIGEDDNCPFDGLCDMITEVNPNTGVLFSHGLVNGPYTEQEALVFVRRYLLDITKDTSDHKWDCKCLPCRIRKDKEEAGLRYAENMAYGDSLDEYVDSWFDHTDQTTDDLPF